MQQMKIVYSNDDDLVNTLFIAAERRDYEGVRYCLKRGADPNVLNNMGRSILHVSAGNGDTHLVDYLCQLKNVDINVKSDNFLITPLHMAVLKGRLDTVALLLKNSANVNDVTRNGCTAMHYAVINNSMDILKILLKYKADVNMVDVFSKTPLSIAILDTRNINIAELLLYAKADVNLKRPNTMPLLCEAILNNCYRKLDLLELLIEFGADVNEIYEHNTNAMHYAALSGSVEIAYLLVDYNCDGTIRDSMNRSPYDLALMHDNTKMARFLKLMFPDEDGRRH